MTSAAPKLSLEGMLTTRAGFALTTASPLQRAICRIADGVALGELAEHPDVVAAVGDIAALPAGERPTELDVLSGIRTAKSLIASCAALHATQTVDVSGLALGEMPRVSVVSLDLDKAQVILDFLTGTILARPHFKRLLVGDPTGDAIVVMHPSGRPIEIKVVAGARAGGSLVARWSAGCIFDEFARMLGSDDGRVVNYDDSRRAVLGRLLPGAQIISISSPWAPMGPAYERCQAGWGKPTRERVVIKAPAPAMNPIHWTPERCEALRASDEIAYTTDVLAEFADPESGFITSTELQRAIRAAPLVVPPRDCRRYVAAIDPGTRGNAWPLVIMAAHYDADGVCRFEVVLAKEWRGTTSRPLSPAEVFREIRALTDPYGIRTIATDQHSADALRDIAAINGLGLHVITIGAGNRNALFEGVKGVMQTGQLSIPDDRTLRSDLSMIRRRLTQTGVTYVLPKTPDGRHADYAPALALALHTIAPAEAGRQQQRQQARLAQIAHSMALTNQFGDAEYERAMAWERTHNPQEYESVWTKIAKLPEHANRNANTSGALAA